MNKIKFQIDNEQQVITFYFKNGEMGKTVKKFLEKNKDISVLSNNISCILAECVDMIGRLTGKDFKNYKPEIVFYKQSFQLPLPLRRER